MNLRVRLLLQSGFSLSICPLLFLIQITTAFAGDVQVIFGDGRPPRPPPPPLPLLVPVTATVLPETTGIVEGSGVYTPGTIVSLKASSRPGTVFSHWSRLGNIVSYDRMLTVVATQQYFFTAHFLQAVTTESLASGAATLSGGDVPVKAGDIYTVSAYVTNQWYVFSGWYVMRPRSNNPAYWFPPYWELARTLELVSTNSEFTFQSDGTGVHLGAQFTFTRKQYNLKAVCDPPFSGRLQGESQGSYPEWDEQIWEQDARVLTASPVPGFEFVGWKSQDGAVVTSETNEILVTTNSAWAAQFSPTCAVAVLRFEWDARTLTYAYGHAKSIPRISKQVQTLSVPAGSNVVFHVYEPRYGFSPRSNPVLSNWRHSGKALAEQSNTLTLTNVGPRDGGTYRFVFQNEGKKYSSSLVRIRVVQPRRR